MLIPFCLLTERICHSTELYGYLESLWGFLRRHNVQLKEATHLCCWVNLLFGEQDDDMMEASKALLSIFLNHRYNKYTNPSVIHFLKTLYAKKDCVKKHLGHDLSLIMKSFNSYVHFHRTGLL